MSIQASAHECAGNTECGLHGGSFFDFRSAPAMHLIRNREPELERMVADWYRMRRPYGAEIVKFGNRRSPLGVLGNKGGRTRSPIRAVRSRTPA